jgi:uncharacterized protein
MGKFGAVLIGLVFLALIGVVCAEPISEIKAKSYVMDYANLFTPEQKINLESSITFIEKNSTVEIAVVTVNDLDGLDIDTYSIELAEKLQVGKKDVDNGLIILIAPKDQKFRIEIGYGLEGVITNAMAGRIGRDILIPSFKQNKFFEGVTNSLIVIKSLIDNDPDVVSQYSAPAGNSNIKLDYFIVLFVVLLMLTSSIRKIKKKGTKWGLRSVYILPIILGVVVGAFLLTGFTILTIIFFFVSFLPPSKTHPGLFYGYGFFGGNGGFGSGGFGGFGGGSFGGGGFSGGW